MTAPTTGPFVAPTAVRPELLRARLLDRLQQRWRVPVVGVVAGAGFGKTTLLAQAHAENLLDPAGVDHWLSCTPDDSRATTLAAHLVQALGMPVADHHTITPDDVASAIASRAPVHLSLLIDDAHLIDPGHDGARFLDELLKSLPVNGHLVLAGRPDLPVALARLRAQGRAVLVTEVEMAFDDTEAAAFATLRMADRAVIERAGGWPALAELHAVADRDATIEFLWEELLRSMAPARRRQLAVLSAIGRADDRLFAAASGDDISVRELVRNLPLSSMTPDGWAALHDLWRPAFAGELTDAERSTALERAGRVALTDDRLSDAFRLFADASCWGDARGVVRVACANSHPLVPLETLSEWLARLIDARAGEHGGAGGDTAAEVTLLQGVIAKQSSPDDAVICLTAAAEAYRAAGRRDEEASCLFHLGHLYWWGDRTDELLALVARVAELAADGSWLATSMLALGAVLLDPASDGDPASVTVDVAGHSRPLHPEIVPLRCWILARNHLFVGDVARASIAAEASVRTATATMRAVSEFLVLQCRWASGDREAVLERLDVTLDAVRHEGWLHFTVADLGQAAMWLALVGRQAEAKRHLDEARATPQLTSVWSEAVLGIADAVLAASAGDDVRAAQCLIDELSVRALDDPSADLAHRPWIALSYVLVPDARPHWLDAGLAGIHALELRCAQALVAHREGDAAAAADATAAIALDHPDDVRRIRNFLPPPWLGELAALFFSGTRPQVAEALLDRAPHEARRRLVALTRGKGPVPSAAVDLLRTTVREPAEVLAIDVLGPLRLRFDGVERWPAELNRRVVRDLLLILAAHERITREQIVAMRWPDDPESAAKASLRSTLSYLNKALEPTRADGEAPVFIVERGDQLALARGPYLTLDIETFDAALRAAAQAEAHGAISAAMHHWLEAVALYRGDYATDAGTADWIVSERDRHRVRFVNAAVRAGGLLVAADAPGRAVEVATRAIAVEPWSEPARTLLAEAYLQLGDVTSARRTVSQCEEMLGDLGVERSRTLAMLKRRLAGPA